MYVSITSYLIISRLQLMVFHKDGITCWWSSKLLLYLNHAILLGWVELSPEFNYLLSVLLLPAKLAKFSPLSGIWRLLRFWLLDCKFFVKLRLFLDLIVPSTEVKVSPPTTKDVIFAG